MSSIGIVYNNLIEGTEKVAKDLTEKFHSASLDFVCD